MINIPRCAKCGRLEPTLVYVYDDGSEEPMCPLCMEELFPVRWTVYRRSDGHYAITDGDYAMTNGDLEAEYSDAVHSGKFTECWDWVMAHDPGMDEI